LATCDLGLEEGFEVLIQNLNDLLICLSSWEQNGTNAWQPVFRIHKASLLLPQNSPKSGTYSLGLSTISQGY
jgi:hypothetical protein